MSEELEDRQEQEVVKEDVETEIEDSPDWIDVPEDMNTQTCIQNRYCFWYMSRAASKTAGNANKYEDAVKKIGSFQTIEHFWRVYDHILRPKDQKSATIDYHIFKHGIKPTWEDPQNFKGGKWIVRLKKGLASRYWEELVFAIIGEQFDVGQEICGAVISIRGNEDIISIWNKTADNMDSTNKIRDQVRRVLQLPAFIAMEYKKHQDSLTDKSSFRNTVVYRAPAGREFSSSYKPPSGERERNRDRSGSIDAPGFSKSTTTPATGNWQQQQQQKESAWKPRDSGRDRDRDRDRDRNDKDRNDRDREERPAKESSSAWGRSRDKEGEGDKERERGGWTRGRPADTAEASEGYKRTTSSALSSSSSGSTRFTRPPRSFETAEPTRKPPSSSAAKSSGPGAGDVDRWTRGGRVETVDKPAEN